MMTDVCAIGGLDDGTLRVCCSTHGFVLCAHHYARTHFVETMRSHAPEHACDYRTRLMLVKAREAVLRNEGAALSDPTHSRATTPTPDRDLRPESPT